MYEDWEKGKGEKKTEENDFYFNPILTFYQVFALRFLSMRQFRKIKIFNVGTNSTFVCKVCMDECSFKKIQRTANLTRIFY